jgi:hypothetical protein
MTTKGTKAETMSIAEKDLLLFWRYAAPCAEEFVYQGVLEQKAFDGMKRQVALGKIPADYEVDKLFGIAISHCALLAKRMGKNLIDEEVIRTYFLLKHSPIVDSECDRLAKLLRSHPEAQEHYADLKVACKTYLGKVVKVKGNSAWVRTSLGCKWYSADFCSVRERDDVAVHFSHIVDVLPEEWVQKIKGASEGADSDARP